MSRQPTFRKIQASHPEVNRLQAALRETLAPILSNPLIGASDYRFQEIAGANGAKPTWALQFRTPGTQTWVTVGSFTSVGAYSGGSAPSGAAGGDLGGTYPNPTVLSVADVASGVLKEANGGTNQNAYAKGDILYASATNTLSRLATGATGQVLKLDGSSPPLPQWGAAAGGTVKQTWYDRVDRIARVTGSIPIAGAGGSQTSGVGFVAFSGLTVTGIKFYWPTASKTIRASLWTNGTRRAFVDVAVSAAGIYTGTFSSPYTLSGTEIGATETATPPCVISLWQTDGVNYAKTSGLGIDDFGMAQNGGAITGFLAGPNWAWPELIQRNYGLFAVGDALPTSLAGTERYWFQTPVFQNEAGTF